MRVTITGGAGNFAQYVAAELAGRGHELILFDRVAAGKHDLGAYAVEHRMVVGDLLSLEDCLAAVNGSDAVVHLGGIRGPSNHPEAEPGSMPWDETMRVNTMGTYYLLEACRRAGVGTAVIASSNCVLGHGFRLSGRPFPFERLPVDESHRLDFEDCYSLSKHLKEDILASYSRAYGLRGYAIRPAYIMRPELQAKHAESAKPPDEWTDWLFGYVDIRDLARAFRMCLEAGHAGALPPFDAYYVNAADTTEPEDTRDLVARLRPDLLPTLGPVTGRQALISTARAERAFGWRAEHSWTEHLPVGAAR
jgi:nucleoside-diphosphate-sugar epimerase